MHLVCQLSECICEQPRASILDDAVTADVLWADNGDAYCLEGFELRRQVEDK